VWSKQVAEVRERVREVGGEGGVGEGLYRLGLGWGRGRRVNWSGRSSYLFAASSFSTFRPMGNGF
jgi:hypothetical protein